MKRTLSHREKAAMTGGVGFGLAFGHWAFIGAGDIWVALLVCLAVFAYHDVKASRADQKEGTER